MARAIASIVERPCACASARSRYGSQLRLARHRNARDVGQPRHAPPHLRCLPPGAVWHDQHDGPAVEGARVASADRLGVLEREEQERLHSLAPCERFAGPSLVPSHDDFAVGEARGGEAPGVGRLRGLDPMHDENDARPRGEGRVGDERTDAETPEHPADAAPERAVLSSAHAFDPACVKRSSASSARERSSGTGADVTILSPVVG